MASPTNLKPAVTALQNQDINNLMLDINAYFLQYPEWRLQSMHHPVQPNMYPGPNSMWTAILVKNH